MGRDVGQDAGRLGEGMHPRVGRGVVVWAVVEVVMVEVDVTGGAEAPGPLEKTPAAASTAIPTVA